MIDPNNWHVPLIFLAFGLACVLTGLIIGEVGRRRDRKNLSVGGDDAS
jgi:hypothetical protein